MLLPEPFVSANGIDELFDRSIVTGCGVKWTGGRDMTTSDGDADSEVTLLLIGFVSSASEKCKFIN